MVEFHRIVRVIFVHTVPRWTDCPTDRQTDYGNDFVGIAIIKQNPSTIFMNELADMKWYWDTHKYLVWDHYVPPLIYEKGLPKIPDKAKLFEWWLQECSFMFHIYQITGQRVMTLPDSLRRRIMGRVEFKWRLATICQITSSSCMIILRMSDMKLVTKCITEYLHTNLWILLLWDIRGYVNPSTLYADNLIYIAQYIPYIYIYILSVHHPPT